MTRQTPRDGSARGQWRAEHFNSVLLTHGCECHWVNRHWEACQLVEGGLDSRRLTNDEHLPSFCASKTMWNFPRNKNVGCRAKLVQHTAHLKKILAFHQVKGLIFSMVDMQRHPTVGRHFLF